MISAWISKTINQKKEIMKKNDFIIQKT